MNLEDLKMLGQEKGGGEEPGDAFDIKRRRSAKSSHAPAGSRRVISPPCPGDEPVELTLDCR